MLVALVCNRSASTVTGSDQIYVFAFHVEFLKRQLLMLAVLNEFTPITSCIQKQISSKVCWNLPMTNYNCHITLFTVGYSKIKRAKDRHTPCRNLMSKHFPSFSTKHVSPPFLVYTSVPTFVFQYPRTTVTENAEACKHFK